MRVCVFDCDPLHRLTIKSLKIFPLKISLTEASELVSFPAGRANRIEFASHTRPHAGASPQDLHIP